MQFYLPLFSVGFLHKKITTGSLLHFYCSLLYYKCHYVSVKKMINEDSQRIFIYVKYKYNVSYLQDTKTYIVNNIIDHYCYTISNLCDGLLLISTVLTKKSNNS